MKRPDEPSKVVALTTGEMKISLGATGEMTLKALSVLQDKDGNIHGRTEFIGPWPKSVVDAVAALQDTVEEFLVTVHFDAGDGAVPKSAVAPGEDRRPTGLFGSGKRVAGEPPQI